MSSGVATVTPDCLSAAAFQASWLFTTASGAVSLTRSRRTSAPAARAASAAISAMAWLVP